MLCARVIVPGSCVSETNQRRMVDWRGEEGEMFDQRPREIMYIDRLIPLVLGYGSGVVLKASIMSTNVSPQIFVDM